MYFVDAPIKVLIGGVRIMDYVNAIKIFPLQHRGAQFIGLKLSDYHHQLRQLKQLPTLRYTTSHRCWYIPYSAEDYAAFKALGLPYKVQKPEEDDSPTAAGTATTVIDAEQASPSAPVAAPTPDILGNNSKIQVIFNHKYFVIKLPYHEEDVKFLKSLRRSWWNNKRQEWYVFACLDNLKQLQQHYGLWDEASFTKLHELIGFKEFPQKITLYRLPQGDDQVAIRLEGYGIDTRFMASIPQVSYEHDMKRYILPKDAKTLEHILAHYTMRGVCIIDRTRAVHPARKWSFQERQRAFLQKTKEAHYPLVESTSNTMLRMGLSWNTFSAYITPLIRYHKWLNGRSIEQADLATINNYVTVVSKRIRTESHLNTTVSAIKFYYEKVVHRPSLPLSKIVRPKKSFVLPTVLSVEQVGRMLDHVDNLKHKTILYTIYSGGLRLGELLNLQLEDILWERNQIWVRKSKGKKDRMVLLSETLKDILIHYCDIYQPVTWLFEGQKGDQYSSSSVQKIVRKAARDAKIRGKVTTHTLRHCFATHLLDKGINIKLIQELLGHKDIKTTMIYTHVSNESLASIRSPLDNLKMKKEEFYKK